MIISLSSSIYLLSRTGIDKNNLSLGLAKGIAKGITKGVVTMALALLKLGIWSGKIIQKAELRKKLGLNYL